MAVSWRKLLGGGNQTNFIKLNVARNQSGMLPNCMGILSTNLAGYVGCKKLLRRKLEHVRPSLSLSQPGASGKIAIPPSEDTLTWPDTHAHTYESEYLSHVGHAPYGYHLSKEARILPPRWEGIGMSRPRAKLVSCPSPIMPI